MEKEKASRVQKTLESVVFWNWLTDEEKKLIESSAVTWTAEKGNVIHRTDGGCSGLMMVAKGLLRTYLISEEGREVTLFRVGGGETCVLSASCLMDTIVFDVFIEAAEETEVVNIPAAVLENVFKTNPKVELELYKLTTERFSDVMWTMQQILFLGVDKRVAIFLWDEMVRTGSETLTLSHEELASYIGSAREVVTKILKYFTQEGIVELGRRKIIVKNREKLKKLL